LFYCYYFGNLSYFSNLSNLSKKLSKFIEFIEKIFFDKWTHSTQYLFMFLNSPIEKGHDLTKYFVPKLFFQKFPSEQIGV
jgi:hypothetical protein